MVYVNKLKIFQCKCKHCALKVVYLIRERGTQLKRIFLLRFVYFSHLFSPEYPIKVQDVIIMQAAKIPKINKRAGCNKAMQVGIFQKSIVKKSSLLEIFQKLINV